MGSRLPEGETDGLLLPGGHVANLLGNEAIVRGALEAGVAFASGYPGTPSSEITDSFARIAAGAGIAFEYAVNEKVAIETAFGASLAGARAICAMKHLGLMAGGDPISTIPYIGTVGGLVIVSAADPSCRTSPNEQDQRYLGPMLHMPVFDPSTPQEALDLTRFAFELSESSRLPVLLRPTTRVCHSRGAVRFGPLVTPHVAGFRRDPRRFNPIPVNARRMRLELDERTAIARTMIADAGLVRRSGAGPRGVLAIGVPAATCADVLEENGLAGELALVSLAAAHPLPDEALLAALDGLSQVLVLEELSPFLEDAVTALCARSGLQIEILGKRSGHAPYPFEYEPQVIRGALHAAFGLGTPPTAARPAPDVPIRPPILCPGCPHRSSYFAARAAFDDDQVFINDIGCYTLGYGAPLETSDALLCMGAGLTIAAGIARTTGQRTVGFIGDSTFFHSGMPGLLDAIKDDVPLTAVVLDNEVTAMTGFQESPTVHVEQTGPARDTSIEEVARALGARHVERIDPNDVAAAVGAFRRAHEADGVSVIVSERSCPVYLQRSLGAQEALVYEIDQQLCGKCGREDEGMRCGQAATIPFSRAMARSRSLEPLEVQAPLPAVAPCARLCPLDLCVQGYAHQVAAGDYAGALELILERLPLPDSVCRVCERPCEDACVRKETDGTVGINALKRFVMDWAARTGSTAPAAACEERHGHDVAIVGAGPAGLAAAHELAVRGYGVTLYDAADEPGGLLRYGIPRYRLPRDVLQRDVDRILARGVRFVGGRRLGTDIRVAELLENGADALFLALGTGVGHSPDLPVREEHPPQRIAAVEYLRRVADGEPVADARDVVVLGGGNAAVDAARTALREGATTVTMVCLESRVEMPAIPEEIDHAVREGVALRTRSAISALLRGAVECVRVDLASDTFAVERMCMIAETDTSVPCDLVIVATGQGVERAFLTPEDPELEWAEDALLHVDPETLRTSHPQIFAGGDVAHRAGDSVTASIAAGLRAAWGIDRALRGPEAADRRRPPPLVPTTPPPGRPGVRRCADERPHVPPELPAAERRSTHVEVGGTLSEDDARAEARRCMNCGTCGNCRACIDTFGCPAFVYRNGRIEIDAPLCIGCGVCEQFCPNGAIHVQAAEAVR